MKTIVVTAAAGTLGSRVLFEAAKASKEDFEDLKLVAIDRREVPPVDVAHFESVQMDLADPGLTEVLSGADSVLHLLGWGSPGGLDLVDHLLSAAKAAGCRHLVFLSSAMVYGAHEDNALPLTEQSPLRPNTAIAYVAEKLELEQKVNEWCSAGNGSAVLLRPTTTLASDGSCWVGVALRAAIGLRGDGVVPAIQFLHYDDLASALWLCASGRLSGVFNVAPVGWLDQDAFKGLEGSGFEARSSFGRRLLSRLAKVMGDRELLDGLAPYATHPWVVASDALLAEGWRPIFDNAEAYVEGSAPPFLSVLSPKRRQELALAGSGVVTIVAIGVVVWSLRKLRPAGLALTRT